jgi:hypothetical protein
MKTRIDRILFSLAVTLLLAGNTALASSRVLPFQGRLSDANGNAIPDGARVVQFKIYDAPVGGRTVWSGEVHKLTVNSGLVSTLLGTKATLAGVDFNQDLYLEITIDANADGQITLADPPLLPRQSILPAVFAQESANARLLGGYDWSSLFGTNNPADGILLASKIGDSSLATAKLADGAVSTAKLANGAVTPGKLNTSGAVAGQSLMFNGTQAIWNQVDALNAQTLKGYDWSSIFSSGNPAAGSMSVANFASRGSADVAGDLVVSGRTFLNGPSTTIQGSLAAPSIGINMFMNDWGLFLRNPGDFNHYLKYGNGFGNQSGFDGPILEGNAGGVLGAGGNWTLRWNNTGTVQVRSTISSGSDRNLKEHFSPINSEQVLDKVLDLPVSTWNYKDDPSASHMGPVAQDFRAAFGLGSDDKSIAVVDADGVALAAIKGLHKKFQQEESSLRDALNEQQKQIKALKAELEALKKDR